MSNLCAVVVAQLAEQSFLTPGACDSNPVIGSGFSEKHKFTVNCFEATKIKEKEAANGPLI